MAITSARLETGGWLLDPQTLAIKLFNDMIQAEVWQSNIYEGNITSLQSLVIEYGEDPSEMIVQTTRALEKFFGAHYDAVTVRISTNDDTEISRYELNIDLVFAKDGKQYSLGRAVFIDNTSTSSIRMLEDIT